MQKAEFNKNSKATPTKPEQRQVGKEPDPAGKAGKRAPADAEARSTPAGTVTQAAQERAKE